MANKILSLLFLIICLQMPIVASESANQTLNTTLPDVLEIEKVYVDNVSHAKDEYITNMDIKDTNTSNPDAFALNLSPVYLEIHTNVKSPIFVEARFDEMIHTTQPYRVPSSQLNFSPSSETILNPYNGVLTGNFTPVVTTTSSVLPGIYDSKITFTLGKI